MASLRKHFTSFLLGLALIPLVGCASTDDKEFSVVAYNVENLFDVDGIAMFDDYQQDDASDPFTYTRGKLLTKLQNHAAVLESFNDGAGPEVILFQEFEADFTPESSAESFEAFLDEHANTTVAEMLGDGWKSVYAGIPSQAWLLKAMADAGLTGYSVVTVPTKGMDSGVAHANAVFSKFPIVSSKAYELEQARDILEVQLDVDGHPLWVYSNHWKSGASNPKREPIRVQNATVLRKLIDARLQADPYADIIIGGDLNSHYNHSILNPDIKTGINDVLGSQGNELVIREKTGPDLYNLWFDVSPEERYSEVWRGRRGTLMHMLITRGLYDQSGVQYVDGSFDKLLLPGLNSDALGRPLEWNFAGESGGGVTDHLPVYARFKITTGKPGDYLTLANPSAGDDAPDFEMPLGYLTDPSIELEDGTFLAGISDAELGSFMGKLYEVDAQILKMRPLSLKVGEHTWGAYAPGADLQAQLKALDGSKAHALIVKLGIWKGNRQLVVEGVR
ncbi:MAG: endonuclease/exonuclease/phosphatase family protein [Opitutaceae bacterium]